MPQSLNFVSPTAPSQSNPDPCGWCGQTIALPDRIFLSVRVTAQRQQESGPPGSRAMLRGWMFCSPECRDAWWAESDGEPLFPVYGPDDYPPHALCKGLGCEVCQFEGIDRSTGLHDVAWGAPDDDAHVDRDLYVAIVLQDAVDRVGREATFVSARPNVLNEWWNAPIEIAEEHLPPPTGIATIPGEPVMRDDGLIELKVPTPGEPAREWWTAEENEPAHE